MSNSVQRKIPITFQKLTNYDDRFMTVKIWLMHLEENYNGSYFSKDVVQSAIPSLANTPILGFIQQNKDKDIDFTDHRSVLVKEKGRYQVKYIGQAYGVIPESNNAQFEKKVCDDGVEREFLTVEGLIWDKWDDSTNIFNRDEVKGQSMELHDKYNGEFEDDRLFHFTDFQFFGACVLGEDVTPAMEGSTIEKYTLESTNFDYKLFMKDVSDKVQEFKTLYSLSVDTDDINLGNKEGEDMTVANVTNSEDEVVLDFVEPVLEPETDFSLTISQLSEGLGSELSSVLAVDNYGDTFRKYWYVDTLIDQNIVVAYDSEESELVGFTYAVNGDEVSIDWTSEKEFKIDYVPVVGAEAEDVETPNEINFSLVSKEMYDALKVSFGEIKSEFALVQEKVVSLEDVGVKFTALEEELVGLREFKIQKDTLERVAAETELFSKFSEKLSDKEIEDVKTSFATASLDEIEKELFVLVGRKVQFSNKAKPVAQATPEVVKITVFPEDSENKVVSNQAPYVASILEAYVSKKN